MTIEEEKLKQNEFKTENSMNLNPEKIRDKFCHCKDVEVDEILDGIHLLCNGQIQNNGGENVKTKKRRNRKESNKKE